MNIFVAKLGPNTLSDELREAFEAFGEVTSAKVIIDKESGNSKGYGFVEMADDIDALEAIRSLDGSDLDGSTIHVKEAVPKEEMQKKPFNRGGGGGGGFNRGGGGGGGFNRGGGGGGGFNRDRNSGGGGFKRSGGGGGGFNRDRNSGGGGFNRDRNSGGGGGYKKNYDDNGGGGGQRNTRWDD